MKVDNSLWTDDQFAPMDNRVTKEDLPDGTPLPVESLDSLPDADIEKLLAGIRQEKTKPERPVVTYVDPMTEEVHQADVGLASDAVSEPVESEVATPVSQYPKTIELNDGATIVFEQTKKGLRATLDSNTGANPERFYGRDETELLQQIAVGKINATQKIHKMNRDMRLGNTQTEIDPNPPRTGRKLTAEEEEQIKLASKTDPIAAMELWYEKRTGQKPEAANEAKIELHLESVAKSFKVARPQYISTDENMYLLVGAMVRDFLKQTITPEQVEQACFVLAQSGFWTVKNLVIYFDGLSEAGLLQVEQDEVDEVIAEEEEVAPAPVPVVKKTAPKPQPAGNPERIVRPRPGSTASYGIRQSAATAPPTENPKGPSDDELDNLSDDAINQLFAGVRRAKLGTRR